MFIFTTYNRLAVLTIFFKWPKKLHYSKAVWFQKVWTSCVDYYQIAVCQLSYLSVVHL